MEKLSTSDILEAKLPDEDHLRKMVMDSEAMHDVLAKSIKEQMMEKKPDDIDPNNPDIS